MLLYHINPNISRDVKEIIDIDHFAMHISDPGHVEDLDV